MNFEEIAAFLEKIDWVAYTAPLTDLLAKLDLAELLNKLIEAVTTIFTQFGA